MVDCGEVESSELWRWLRMREGPSGKYEKFKDTYCGERTGEGDGEGGFME